MKKRTKRFRRILGVITLAAVLTLTTGQIGTLKVSAGSNEIVIDNSSFNENLDSAKWNAPNNDILIKNGKIVFPEASTEETRLITKSAMAAYTFYEEIFRSDYTLTLKKLPEGKEFIVALGLANIESCSGEAGSVEIFFQNNNGIKVGIRAYDDSGEVTTLAESKSCGIAQGAPFKMSVKAAADMKLKVVVNNQTIYDKTSPVSLEGRIGFLQTGSCEAEISAADIYSRKYDQPENPNVSEDFESGSMNVNSLTSKMILSSGHYPSAIQVEDYNGSNVLMFRNAQVGYIGSLYKYSNFELTFDVPYIIFDDVLNEDGTVKEDGTTHFIVTFGGVSKDYDAMEYATSTEGIIFRADNIETVHGGHEAVSITDKFSYDPVKKEGYSVKVSVIDTEVAVLIKAPGAADYKQVMKFTTGKTTPLGYVDLWVSGPCNFAIDNFKIENKDKEARLINVEYKAGTVEGTEDWAYEPEKVEYLDNPEAEAEKEFNWVMVPVCAAIAGAVIIIVCVVIAKAKNTSKKKER